MAAPRQFTLSAPAELIDSGLLRFLVPRFSLKTATRVQIVPEDKAAVARFNRDGSGRAVFTGPLGDWYLDIAAGEAAAPAKRFEKWLTGDVGRKTIAAYTVDGEQPYEAASGASRRVAVIEIQGDAALGERLSVRHCGRCHMVNDATRLTTIGSTPSFALMRGFEDWMRRFQTFYALNPHPSFTLVENVTPPFDESLPPPIEPVRVSVDDIQAILSYVVTIEPADLGAPLQRQ